MTSAPTPERKRLALATLAAFGLALVVLVLFILPAEYGIDPTGVGAIVGLTALNDPTGAGTDSPQDTTPPATIATYESAFPTASAAVLTQEGYLDEGGTAILPFDIAQTNVTKVTLRIEFEDDNTTPNGQSTRPDLFEIRLKAPRGAATDVHLVRSDPSSGAGSGEVTLVVRDAPVPREFDAASEREAAAAFVHNDPPDTGAIGEWEARVTLLEAGDADAQGVPLAVGPAADTGDEWKITVLVETYALAVSEKPGTRQRSDTVTLVLPAGGELEYKLAMALGKRLDYSWRTDGPRIYVDFHGEKAGDASGAFTRHKNGDFAADAGTLVAPFDGRHGFFWRNTHAEPVTITLETRGQYDIIGRV